MDAEADVEEICNKIFEEIKARKALVDLDLFRLHLLYNTTLAAALGLIDMGKIDLVVSKSGRSVFLVHGSMAIPYVCFKHYCPCLSFSKSVINRTEALACKHVLAVRLADSLGRYNRIEVEDAELSDMLVREDKYPVDRPKTQV